MVGEFLERQLDHAPSQALSGREFSLQLPLMQHEGHRVIDAEHPVIASHDFARRARLAVVKQNEVLRQVQQTPVLQHAVQQHLRFQAAFVLLIEPLPFGEMLPLAGDEPYRARWPLLTIRKALWWNA